MMSGAESKRPREAERELESHERDLTYAERQLDPKGRAEATAQRYFRGNLVRLTVISLWSIGLLLLDDETHRLHYVAIALALWVVYSAVNFAQTLGAMKQIIADTEEVADSEHSTEPAQPNSALKLQAEFQLRRHLSELNYAEHQLRKEGSYELLANSLYRRKRTNLALGLPVALWFLLSNSSLITILLGGKVLYDFVCARETRAVISRLVQSRSIQTT